MRFINIKITQKENISYDVLFKNLKAKINKLKLIFFIEYVKISKKTIKFL